MRETLTLQSPTRVANSQGSGAYTFATVAAVAADLLVGRLAPGGSERLQGPMIVATARYGFRIRYRADVGPTWRALWRPSWSPQATPKTLEIAAVAPDPLQPRAYLRLECGEVA